jgi:hypothetical protein
MARRAGAAVLGTLSLVSAASPPAAVRRAIATSGPGPVAVALDADVYDRARRDLADLRIVDDRGGQVPYLRPGMDDGAALPTREPVILNRGFVRGLNASLTLDFGGPTRKSALTLSLPGDNFRRRVTVEGRHEPDAAWTTLVESAYVFAVPGPPPARYETVAMPENDFARLRVTVFRAPDDPAVLEIRKAWISAAGGSAPEMPVARAWFSRAEDQRTGETVLTIELGARFQPLGGLVLEVGDRRFFREVVVEARRPPLDDRQRPAVVPVWMPIASAAVYRYEEGGRARERLRVDAAGREQALRVRIRNGGDRPLDIRALTVRAPVERLGFEAQPERRYWLEYGVPGRAMPSYDLARTVGDHAAWVAAARPAGLGHPQPRGSDDVDRPWTERHPALLWAGLLAAVLALGALTWRALRAAG